MNHLQHKGSQSGLQNKTTQGTLKIPVYRPQHRQMNRNVWGVGLRQQWKSTAREQGSPSFLAPGTGFVEDSFSTNLGAGDGFGMIQACYIYCALYFYYYYTGSTSYHQALGTGPISHCENKLQKQATTKQFLYHKKTFVSLAVFVCLFVQFCAVKLGISTPSSSITSW